MKYIKYILILALLIFGFHAMAFSGTTSLRYGSRGQGVAELQAEMQRQGYLPANATVDGRFGRVTLRAVQLYQQEHNLNSDGVVGRQTLSILRGDNSTMTTTTTTDTNNSQTHTAYYTPTITIYGYNPDNHPNWGTNGYVDPGYGATDPYDGNITKNVVITDGYDQSSYCNNTMIRTYSVTNSRGVRATATRKYIPPTVRECAAPPTEERIVAGNNTAPTITLTGPNPDNAPAWGNNGYIDPGYTATDREDGNITSRVTHTDQYDPAVYCSNTMIRTYTVTDSSGSSATAQRRYTPPFVRECAAPPTGGQHIVQ